MLASLLVFTQHSRMGLNLLQDGEDVAATELAFPACQHIQRGFGQGQRDVNQRLEGSRGERQCIGLCLYELSAGILAHLIGRPSSREKIYTPRQVFRAVAQDIDSLQAASKLDGGSTMQLLATCPGPQIAQQDS